MITARVYVADLPRILIMADYFSKTDLLPLAILEPRTYIFKPDTLTSEPNVKIRMFFTFFSFNLSDIEPGTVDIFNTDAVDSDADVILESITYL